MMKKLNKEQMALLCSSEQDFLAWLNKQRKPVPIGTLYDTFNLNRPDEKARFREVLQTLKRAGDIVSLQDGYSPVKTTGTIAGWVNWDKEGNYEFLPEDGSERMKLSGSPMRLFPQDKIEISIRQAKHSKDEVFACFKDLIEATRPHVVGTYEVSGDKKTVNPFHRRYQSYTVEITGMTPGLNPASGEVIVVELDRAQDFDILYGHCISVLGTPKHPNTAIQAACFQFNIPHLWPDRVLEEAKAFEEDVPEDAKLNRVDYRNIPFVTIDGEDARDFDDAVYCQLKEKGGYTLYVAIADVSHYVKANSALDMEAIERGTSVYFPDSVIPMLPEVLSNGLCSLKPHVDRLAMVCEMDISKAGKVKSFEFHEGVIQSHQRFTYTQVQTILDGHTGPREQFKDFIEDLNNLHELYKILHEQRTIRGAIDFDTVETKIFFDEEGKIQEITPVSRITAHKIIEECMLAANVSAAQFLKKNRIPSLYRVHPEPPPAKRKDLQAFLASKGLSMNNMKAPTPKDYAEFLASISDREDFNALQTVILRSLSQACYTVENEGHFGLAYEAYLHFTSPIRRYPDLSVHRSIRAILQKRSKELSALKKNPIEASKLAMRCSMAERRADDATRDVEKILKCLYLEQHIGDTIIGTIIGVTSFGVFVELDDLFAEGLIHISQLGSDYFVFDQSKQHLMGEGTHETFELGDRLLVRLADVNVESRRIDLTIIERINERIRGKGQPGVPAGRAAKKKPQGGRPDRRRSNKRRRK